MDIKQRIQEHIRTLTKSTITLEEMEALFIGVHLESREFAEGVLELEELGMLEAIKVAGRSAKQPSIAFRYRINKHLLTKRHKEHLQQFRLKIHPAIQLDDYFSLSESEFEEDKPLIVNIDHYLKQHGFPNEAAPAPERSFQLVGNEKWITELGGNTLLKRLGLWESLLIYPVADPLMLAVNPDAGNRNEGLCLHLIVENKTTFQALLPALPMSIFHTLIYGCGNKITGNIDMFPLQFPIVNAKHLFFYFGDIDYEGIRIWHEANKKCSMKLALPFYEACLSKPHVMGKTNQRRSEEAVQAFLKYFTKQQQEQIAYCLTSGGYYPQETLTTQKLQQIWKGEQWNKWTITN